jgi:SNF2 family DNA or RNA helicase
MDHFSNMITKTSDTYIHKMKPLRHQEESFKLSKDRKYYALWWEMGTCKSKTIIDTFTWLYLQGEIDGVIIISDKGCYMNWYDREIEKHMMDGVDYRLCAYSSSMPQSERRAIQDMMTVKPDCLDILCMNVEAFSHDGACDLAKQFIDNHWTMMVIDECTSIKNPRAERTKRLKKLGRIVDYRRILTGTPITQSPLDLFSMCDFLQPELLGHRSFTGFRSEYAIMRMIPMGNRSFEKIVGYRGLDRITAMLRPFSTRYLKSECLDLPEKIYEEVEVQHTEEQTAIYQKLKQEAMVMHQQGLLTVTSAIVMINKLHQVNCGHVKLDDHTIVHINSQRIPVLMELLDRIGRKVVVWCNFQEDIRLIISSIGDTYRNQDIYPVSYYGETDQDDRRDAIHRFTTDPKCMWFIGTAATGGKGIDGLQNVCDHAIYFSCGWSLEKRLQSEDRLHRNGQKNHVTITDLLVKGTVDERVLKALQMKEDLGHQVLDQLCSVIGI